jgi:ketosteroid isomerase-like protein
MMSHPFVFSPRFNSLNAMSRQSQSRSAPNSTSGTISAFYDRLESSNTRRLAALWSDDGVYLNPFARGSHLRSRVAGRDEVVETIRRMRSAFDTLEFRGRVEEPALVPQNPSIVVYVTGDCHFILSGDPETRRHHFHHRLEILDGKVTGWIDYTNPLTDSQAVPTGQSAQSTEDRTKAESPLVASGDGVPVEGTMRPEGNRSLRHGGFRTTGDVEPHRMPEVSL